MAYAESERTRIIVAAVDGAGALSRAGIEFGNRLDLVTTDAWQLITPCDAWTVHDLVDHVVGGNARYAMILRGDEPEAVLATHDVDSLGSDPVGAFRSSFLGVAEAFGPPGILTATVQHPKSGPMTGAQLRVLRVNELTVHGWDLARAIGANEVLDDGLVKWLFDRLYPLRDTIARSGLYAPRQPSREEAEPVQARLLHLLGRRP